jgi:two-component system chemotaxis sensor kinase CheA
MSSKSSFYSIDGSKLKIGLVFSLVILFVATILSFFSISKLIQQSTLVDHTNKVIIGSENIISTLKDAETSQRGFLLTKDSSFLKLYYQSYNKTKGSYNRVMEFTKDNKDQQQRLKLLKQYLDKRYALLALVLNDYGKNGEINKSAMVEGTNLMTRSRVIITTIKDEEYRLLKIRSKEVDRYSNTTPIIILISSLISIFISGFAFVFINKDMANKKRNQEELERLNSSLVKNQNELELNKKELAKQNYILSGSDELINLIIGERNLKVLSQMIINKICEYVNADAGVLYLLEEDGNFYFASGYAFEFSDKIPTVIKPGEGVAGQAAIQQKIFVKEGSSVRNIQINSLLTSTDTVQMLVLPINATDETLAIIELISSHQFSESSLEYLEIIRKRLAVNIKIAKSENKTFELLNETQNQAEELETQQEELRQINDELKEQRNKLQSSEEELRVSQEELEEKNSELEVKAAELEEQYEEISNKNAELENARTVVELKMKEVESMSKYKSEFLANMSHELRTPLNSILILSKLISDNKSNKLSDKEVEFASIIYNSGNDLLRLINDILDLSKIEAGKIALELKPSPIKEILIYKHFQQLAKERNVTFEVWFEPGLPPLLITDQFRLEQILKNLLSNAFKFTNENGKVTYRVYGVKNKTNFKNPKLAASSEVIAFSVSDTGIGIAADRLNIIFEAFQQADTSTTRKYGGTGLGLSISRELAHLLGGEIQVESELNKGSNFTLYLPLNPEEQADQEKALFANALDKENLHKVSEIAGSSKSEVLDKKVLIVEDNETENFALKELLKNHSFTSISTFSGLEALEVLTNEIFNVVILDINLPDIEGFEVLKKIKETAELKNVYVIIYSGKDLSEEELLKYSKYADRIVIKTGSSYKRLLDELTLAVSSNSKAKFNVSNEQSSKLHRSSEALKGKKVLLVDDDMRNIFSLMTVLEEEGMEIVVANNGKQALEKLDENKDTDVILMDIMMPEMDGLECTRRIRNNPEYHNVPVIAVTAKAMKEDREKSIQAGASDYITKPIDANKLTSLMKVWTYKEN